MLTVQKQENGNIFQYGWEYKNKSIFHARTTGSPSKTYFDGLKLEEVTPQEGISLSPGWNEIVWPDISGKKASDIPPECPIAVAQENLWFKPYVKDFGGLNFGFESGKTYYLKCNQGTTWNL